MSDEEFKKLGHLYVLDNTPADALEPKPPQPTWFAYEESGCEVKFAMDWEMSQAPAENNLNHGKYKTITDCPGIHEAVDLHLGDEVLVVHLIVGWVKAKVTQVDYANNSAQAETAHTLFPLEFGKDHRKTWVCSMALNKNAINKIELKDPVP